MYKLLGIALMLVCGLGVPRLRARERRAALSQVEALTALVRHLRHEIEADRRPLLEIRRRCEPSLLLPFGGKADSLADLFGQTCWLDGEAKRCALSLSETLGRGSLSDEVALCERTLEQLEGYRAARLKSEEGKQKSEGALALGGVALVVLFLI